MKKFLLYFLLLLAINPLLHADSIESSFTPYGPPPEPRPVEVVPPAPIRGTYSGLNVLSMGIPIILIAGLAAIILTTPAHHSH